MPQKQMLVRPYRTDDEESLVSLWQVCELTVPWNNPHKDIARKLQVQPELFLVGILDSRLIATVMGIYARHLGGINYLAVHPDFQGNGYGQEIMNSVETGLREMGFPFQFADSYCKRYDVRYLPKTWFYQGSCSQYGKTTGG